MTLQTDLDTAKAALAAAQAAETAAQAAFDAAQPYLTLWAKVEARAALLEESVKNEFTVIVAEARNLIGM